jgi:hypothetical protein
MPGVLRATSRFDGDVERLLGSTSYQHRSTRATRSLLAVRRPVIGSITSKPLALGFIAKRCGGAKKLWRACGAAGDRRDEPGVLAAQVQMSPRFGDPTRISLTE